MELALLELVARSYEAGATAVSIRVTQRGIGRAAVVLETNAGMPDGQLENLGNVGSPLAEDPNPQRMWSASTIRQYGNLAYFSIGRRIEIQTCRKGSGVVSRVAIDLGKLEKLERPLRALCTSDISKSRCGRKECWTRIVITEIPPEKGLGPATVDMLAANVTQRLMFADPNFTVEMSVDNVPRATVSNRSWGDVVTKSSSWKFPDGDLLQYFTCEHWREVAGSVDVSGIVLPDSSPGIRLFVDSRPANKPELFGASVPKTFAARTSGSLHVDFVAGHKGAIKSGNPPSIDWGHPEMKNLREDLGAAVENIYFLWAKQCEEAASSLLKGKIDSEWFRDLSPAQQSGLLGLLISMEHSGKGHMVDHTLRVARDLVSPHPRLNRRTFHRDITSNRNIMELCDSKNYYQAVIECVKVYCDKVREISGVATQARESELMRSAFNPTKRGRGPAPIVLSTVNDEIGRNIQKGHGLLSQGLVYGVKNPAVSHSSQENLAKRGLFTEDDCLDILSLVSYLFRRIEKRGCPSAQE